MATAEGVAKIQLMGARAQKGGGSIVGSGSGASAAGGVGEACVEMLGRLTNQLLSR